ncbi:hypothetical protein [Micromonospora robiginosa]|uniref:Uncharacterized protein n=1 Tax=Micromonospora robiginosa TaxID=2749844 RepID=A0A7L6B5N9_9ACTN|nr:hypothetical protein [Micromonospora ferruginea]QLQ36920.1 hypothetical protein H1D33_27375 [Micromonospora ferruginea]
METSPDRRPRRDHAPGEAPEPARQRAVGRPHRSTARGGGDQPVPREPGRGHRRGRTNTPARPATGRRRRTDPAAGRPPAAAAGGDPALDGADDPPERPTRRRAALAALVVAAAASATVLVTGLLSGPPQPGPGDGERPLSAAEADRVAALRVTNLRDVRAGVRVTVGAGRDRTDLLGWVDWARPLVYLDVGGPGAGADRGLVQATASTLLVRPDATALPTPARPPLVPPEDRWRLREPVAGRGLDAVRDLLLGLGADRVDPVGRDGRWLRRESIAGVGVDVLRAPLAVPTGDPRPTLWLDRDARLHRLTGRLPDGTAVTVDLVRVDRPTTHPIDALGGRPGQPRPLTDDEADRLARLPARLRAAGGATLSVAAPFGPSANLDGTGTLSWTRASAAVTVTDADTGRRTRREVHAGAVAHPDDPAPPGPGDEVDRLLSTSLLAGVHPPDGPAVRIREDQAADRTVDVVEVPGGLRWWLDRTGLPHRLELRSGRGVWLRLDLSPGPATAS